MADLKALLATLPGRYRASAIPRPLVYYFSIGADKVSLKLGPAGCQVVDGKIDPADCVVKSDPAIFEALVTRGKVPGPIDLARGKFKTNDPALLALLKEAFQL